MNRKELEKKADKLLGEYNKLQGCLEKLDEIEALEVELSIKKLELELELEEDTPPVDSKSTIIINPPKTYVALDGQEIPCVTKGSYTVTPKAAEAFNQATTNTLNRIFNKTVGGVYDSLGECPGIHKVSDCYHYGGWGKIIKEGDYWKTKGLGDKEITQFVGRKIIASQIGNRFCSGNGASVTMSTILRAVLWDVEVDSDIVRDCVQLNNIYQSLTNSGINNFRSVTDFGLKGNNGYVTFASIKILEHFGVRDILDKITFWSCPGKGAKKNKNGNI